jgi:hypothetical protein
MGEFSFEKIDSGRKVLVRDGGERDKRRMKTAGIGAATASHLKSFTHNYQHNKKKKKT